MHISHKKILACLKFVVSGFVFAAMLSGCNGSSDNSVQALDDANTGIEVSSDNSSPLLDVSNTSTVLKAPSPGFDHKFGKVVLSSADGKTIIVTEPVSYGFGNRIGVAYVYEKGAQGWRYSDDVFDPESAEFGEAAALTPDGRRLVIGAPRTNLPGYRHPLLNFETGVAAGKLIVYDKTDAGDWVEAQQIVVEQPTDLEHFSESIDISDDGTTIVAGASGRACALVESEADLDQCAVNSGAIYVITLQSDGTWATPQRIRPEAIGSNYYFGRRLSMNADGSTVAVTVGGLVTVWQRDSRGSYVREEVVTPIEQNDLSKTFGAALSLSADGNTLVVGSTYQIYSEAAYLVNAGVAGYSTPYAGTVSVYERSDGLWSAVQQLLPPIERSFWARFGSGIATTPDGARIAVGMTYANSLINANGGEDAGAAFVFDRVDGQYQPVAWAQPTHSTSAEFGTSLALSNDGKQLVVGAPGGSFPGSGINPPQDADREVLSGDAYVLQLPDISR